MKLAILAVVLAGCGGPAPLPDQFRIEAEVVDVTGPRPDFCTPTIADRKDGPDWSLEFASVNSAPRFREVRPSTNPDQSYHCDPLVADGDDWSLACVDHVVFGGDREPLGSFVFKFGPDGSGSSTTTLAGLDAAGTTLCTARTTWPALVPL